MRSYFFTSDGVVLKIPSESSCSFLGVIIESKAAVEMLVKWRPTDWTGASGN